MSAVSAAQQSLAGVVNRRCLRAAGAGVALRAAPQLTISYRGGRHHESVPGQ
jgi:hypothetical protein